MGHPGEDSNVFLTIVVPAFGALISLLMYASPVQAIMVAAKNKSLGDLNPIPFSITVANTIVWATYGLLTKDPFVTAPNAPGIVVAMFCALTSFGLADDKTRARIRLLLCAELAILSFLGVLTSFATDSISEQRSIWGVAGNIISLVYYAAPLSSMAQVLRTRNAASILLPMTIMNTANAGLWTTYGLALHDLYIYLPNGIGLVLSVAQLMLTCIFPSKPTSQGISASAAALHEANYTRLSIPEDEVRLTGTIKSSSHPADRE